MTARSSIFRFEGFEAHEREFSLVKAGETLAVEPKAFRVLLILLRNPKKLIPKEELLNAVWGDAAVTENSLTRAIALLRRLLGDDAREPKFIETVTSVGYRWLCPVEQAEGPNAASAAQEPDKAGLANGTSPPGTGTELSPVAAGQSRGIGAIDAASQPDETGVGPARRTMPWIWIAVAALSGGLLAGFAVAWLRPSAPARLRFKAQIASPEAEWTSFQISPDGKFLSLAHCEAFACKISLRPLESLEFQTIGEGIPAAWSPDSKFLVSMSAGKLYKNSAQGGPPVYLADAPAGYNDAAWLDTGSIVVAAESGLFRLPESGGILTKLSSQFTFGASWLPGDRFLYANDHGVYASSVRGDKPVQVLPDSVDATYVPPARAGLRGHLVFTRAGALLAQEFDLNKLETVGDPVHIVPSGSDPGGVYVNSVAASRNGVLAFRAGDYDRLALTWFDRSGKKLQTVSQPFELGSDATNRLSPDDSKSIVLVAGPNGRPDLWLADLERGTFTRFTFDGAIGGLWAPDGKNMIWADIDYHIYRKAADGSGNSELLFKNPNCASCLIYDWSQDGKLCSFATVEAGTVKIWLAAVDGDRKPYPFRQGGFNDFYGMFSPDHRWLAYASDESGQTQVYVESIPSGRRRLQVSTEGGNWPIWRHDGTELFYRQEKDVMAVSVRITATDIEIGKPQKLFSAPIVTRFMVSRDGQRFLIALPVENVPASAPITVDTDWRTGLARPK